MDREFWIEKWKQNDTKFHQKQTHPALVRHWSNLPKGKVIVPLCGKSNDMLWFKNQGHQVDGIELSVIACESFFDENQLQYETLETSKFQIRKGEKVTLWCGDFFESGNEIWKSANYIYDRAALVALPPKLRVDYANHIRKSILEAGLSKVQMLLITFEYSSKDVQGPPFSVRENEVTELFSSFFEISCLERSAKSPLAGNHPKFLNEQVFESVYQLRQK